MRYLFPLLRKTCYQPINQSTVTDLYFNQKKWITYLPCFCLSEFLSSSRFSSFSRHARTREFNTFRLIKDKDWLHLPPSVECPAPTSGCRSRDGVTPAVTPMVTPAVTPAVTPEVTALVTCSYDSQCPSHRDMCCYDICHRRNVCKRATLSYVARLWWQVVFFLFDRNMFWYLINKNGKHW